MQSYILWLGNYNAPDIQVQPIESFKLKPFNSSIKNIKIGNVTSFFYSIRNIQL